MITRATITLIDNQNTVKKVSEFKFTMPGNSQGVNMIPIATPQNCISKSG